MNFIRKSFFWINKGLSTLSRLHIILVPFFGAKPAQLLRHESFFKAHNYLVTTVKLTQTWSPLIGGNGKVGMKAKWAKEISDTLDQIAGPKVLFAFSNPGAAAIEAIVERNAFDILGLICDSGPSGDFYQSALGLLKHHIKVKSYLFRAVLGLLFYLFWSPGWNRQLKKDMSKLPFHFPILSIQCEQDLLISPKQIDLVFDVQSPAKLQKLVLPKVGHLMGLKQCTQIYESTVLNFLTNLNNLP